jgi:CHAT domain-containing protein/tetratricopeptide (TPR) repeat protein
MRRALRRAALLLRCFGYLLLALPVLTALLALLFVLSFLALPVLLVWSVCRNLLRAREQRTPEPETSAQARSRQLEAQGAALLAEGDELLARAFAGGEWDLTALEAALDRFRRVRDLGTREHLPGLRGGALARLGEAWLKARKAPGYEPALAVREASRAFRQQLALLEDRTGLAAAIVLRDLGVCLFISGRRWQPQDLESALSCFTLAAEALRWWPYQNALTQHWLGATLVYRKEGLRERNLDRAIRCFQQARHPELPAALIRDTGSLLDRAVRDLWGAAATLVLAQAAAEPESFVAGRSLAAAAPGSPTGTSRRSAALARQIFVTVSTIIILGTLVLYHGRPVIGATAIGLGSILYLAVIPGVAETFEALLLSLPTLPQLAIEGFRLTQEDWAGDSLTNLISVSSSGREVRIEIEKALARLDRRRFPFVALVLTQLRGRLLSAFPAGETGDSVEEAILLLRSCEPSLRRRRLRILRVYHQEALARALLCRQRGDLEESSREAIEILSNQILPFVEYFPAYVNWLARKRTLVLLAAAFRQHGAAVGQPSSSSPRPADAVARARLDLIQARDRYREALNLPKPRLLRLLQGLKMSSLKLLDRRTEGAAGKMAQRLRQFLPAWHLLTDAAALNGLAETVAQLERSDHGTATAESAAFLLAALRNLKQADERLRASLNLSLVHVRRQQIAISLRLAGFSALFTGKPEAAEAMLRSAVRQAMREGFEELAAEGLVELGCRLHDQGRYEAAVCALSAVLAAADRMRWQILSLERRAELLRQRSEPFDRLLLSAVATGNLAQAVELSERSRCRGLVDLLSLRGVLPRQLPSAEVERFQRTMFEARDRERRIKSFAASTAGSGMQLESELYHLRQELHDLLDSIQEKDPDFLPAARPLGIEEIWELARASSSAIVLLRITERESCAFLVYPDGTLDLFRTRSFTRATLDALVLATRDGWLERRSGRDGALQPWLTTMDKVLAEVSHHLIAPVHESLLRKQATGTEPFRLVLVPSRGTAILPLHACFRIDGAGRRYLLDDFTIRYAPNLTVLARCLERDATQSVGQRDLFAVGNPRPREDPLDVAEWECEKVASLFESAVLRRGDEATPGEVRTRIASFACVHFACHASYLMDTPLDSWLQLAQGGTLTLGEILEDLELPRAWLVALSACETGLVDSSDPADEHYGLATAFLCAGASTVWSTLWRIDDLPAALLIVKAYENLFHQGCGKAEALRAAQVWLRELTIADLIRALERWGGSNEATTGLLARVRRRVESEQRPSRHPFRHPHYWASFQSIGA